MSIEGYCLWLASRFFAPGVDREDLAQEARIAAWLEPEHPRLAARRQVLDVVKRETLAGEFRTERRPELVPLDEHLETRDNVADLVEARANLRAILCAPRNANERTALGRRLRGEPIRRHEKALDIAWFRLRERLAA